jgi:hypothetical protein
MSFTEILLWCRANNASVRGVYRGKTVSIAHTDDRLPGNLPALDEIFHWDVKVGELRYIASASDLKRLISGKVTMEEFKGTARRNRAEG